ncbi:hypothetical protein BDP27DRAFT_1431033 [Rhodocollybia butyracea]|uniref:Uncharacterized protein n=1 Tax=Rhodocollybia butyracea TaxID=206335 RepID=A0A9P5PAN9_9AGAR|nr:hypothetical protein BDP27DRAFT_1431033 [Rhodocollybia butyracea]
MPSIITMSSLYTRYPTYDKPLSGNLALQSSDFAKALFGIILQWQEETGCFSVQQLMSCVEGILKHHISINMGTSDAQHFGALVVRNCADCAGPNNDRLSLRLWTPAERLGLLQRYINWLIDVEARDELEGLISRISRITELEKTASDYRHLKKKLCNAVALLNKNNTEYLSSHKPKDQKRKRDSVDEGRADGVKKAKYTSRYTPEKVEDLMAMCKEIEAAVMDPLMLNNELAAAMNELKETLNTFT